MSEAPSNTRQELQHVEAWGQAFGQVLGQIAGAPVSTAISTDAPPELGPAFESDVWILCALSGGLRGELALRLSCASALQLAQVFMSEPGNSEAALTAEHREATVELLRQIAGLVATELKGTWGEVQLHLDLSSGAPSWPASSTYWVRAGNETMPATIVELHISAALAAALRSPSPATAPAVAASPAVTDVPAALPLAPPSPVNLDLLMDVELGVTLRFGSRRLLLREILDLNPGSVVELDREVSQPVDVLLDGRLMARGEVVVLNGCYGLRVTEAAP